MTFYDKLNDIEKLNISFSEKIMLLKSIILDVTNELDARDQNMHPEIDHDLAKKLSVATEILRKLENQHNDLDICNQIRNDEIIRDSSEGSPEIDSIKDICGVPKR